MGGTRRLTTAQAVVAFLRQQYVERDGDRGRFISGIFGIFGHGNVAGMGEALEAEAVGPREDALRYLQARNEQGMVHTATRIRQAATTPAHVRVHQLHRPGRHEHDHGRRDSDGQPAAGAAAARGPVQHPAGVARAPAARATREPARERQRCLPSGVPLLGPDRPPQPAGDRTSGRVPGPHVARGDRRGDPVPAPGHPGRGLGLPGRAVRGAHLGRAPHEARRDTPGTRRGCHRGRQAADDRGRWRCPVLRRGGSPGRVRVPVRHPRGRDTGRQGSPRLGSPAPGGTRRRDRRFGRKRDRP